MTSPPASDNRENDAPAAGSARGPSRWGYVVFLVRGSVALVLGVALLIAGSNPSRLVTFVAVYWVVAGLLTLRWASAQPALPHRPVALAAGVLGLVVGVAVVLREVLHALLGEGVWLDLLGASAIAIGLLRLVGLLHDDQLAREHPRRRYRFVLGCLEVLLGITLVIADQGATTQIRVALGLWGLATGTLLLLDALMMRRHARHQARSAP